MGKADPLSRRPDHKEGVENDNDKVTLLKPKLFSIKALQQGHVLIKGAEEELLTRVRKSKNVDEAVVKAVAGVGRSSAKRLRSEEWSEEQGLILFRGKVYVPKDDRLRSDIIKLHHDSPVVGHPGRFKTMELISHNYWWPGMTKLVTTYVEGCDKCQRYKNFPKPPAGKLMPIAAPQEPWKAISADFVVGLPPAQGFDALLVVVDRAGKGIHVIPTTQETNTLGLTKLYCDNVWKLHGLPDSILSDRGLQFMSALMKELNSLLSIQTKLSTACHPQTDGQTERVNQEVEQYLQLFINHQQHDWPEWIPLAEFSHN